MKPITVRLALSVLCLFLLWLGLIIAAAYGDHGQQQIPADTAEPIRGFEPSQQSGDRRYRWTNGDAIIPIPAHQSAAGLIVDLELTGPQWVGAMPANQTIRLDQGQAITLSLPPTWRHYRLLLSRGSVSWGEPLLYITGPTQSLGIGDSRNLGAALSMLKVVSVPDPRSQIAIERGTFLLLLVLAFGMVVLLFSSWKWLMMLTGVVGIIMCITEWLLPTLSNTLFPVDYQIGAASIAIIVALALPYAYRKLFTASVTGSTFVWIGGIVTRWFHKQINSAGLIRLAGLALGAALGLLFTFNLGTFDFIHVDEVFWMPTGRHAYQLFFIDHNYTDAFWYEFGNPFLAYHPQIGKFLIGASIAAAGIPDMPYPALDWSQTIAWNIQHGFQINPTALLAARLPVALLSIVACMTLYWLSSMVASWWHGLLAALFLASNTAMLRLGRLAMLDVPALCFSLLTIALIVRIVQNLRSGQNGLRWSMIAGMMGGLAIGSKLIALTLVGPAILVLLYEALRYYLKNARQGYEALVCVAMLIGLSGLIFYVSNPLLYGQPITGTLHMFEFVQVIQRTNTYSPTPTLLERLVAVVGSPADYGFFTTRLGLPFEQIMVLLGCLAIGIDLWRIPALRQQQPLDIVVMWMVASTLLITVSLPANIDRYVLPLQPSVAFLQAYGTIWVANRAVMLIRKRFGSIHARESSKIY